MQAFFTIPSSNTALEHSLTISLEDFYVGCDIHVDLVLQKIEKVTTVNKGSSFSNRHTLYIFILSDFYEITD